jgi:crossover junction endodeoxyribonuclease RusA
VTALPVVAALEVFVPGRPAPQGSKTPRGRLGGHVQLVESSKTVGPWRQTVAYTAAQVFVGPPLDGPLLVRLGFVMPRPAATPKRRTPPAVKKPDVDKLARAVFDALTSVVWRDDSQVVDVHATKRLAELDETPGVHIVVAVKETV